MAQRKESHGEIDWSAAEVEDSVLTVPLTGEPSKAWTERVAEVVERLKRGGGGWDEVEVGRKAIEVSGVQAGAESDLRHFLEGAVMQANADFAPEPEPEAARAGSEADGEMTRRSARSPSRRRGKDRGRLRDLTCPPGAHRAEPPPQGLAEPDGSPVWADQVRLDAPLRRRARPAADPRAHRPAYEPTATARPA